MRKLLILIFAIFIASTIVAENRIVVSKKEMTLTVYNDSDSILLKTKISCGKNFGNKTRRGDNKTPEGTFKINMIQPSS